MPKYEEVGRIVQTLGPVAATFINIPQQPDAGLSRVEIAIIQTSLTAVIMSEILSGRGIKPSKEGFEFLLEEILDKVEFLKGKSDETR